MLIPSIDLQGGKVVQLVQGERLAIESDDIDSWVRRFAGRPKVQLIDLDAAKGEGDNRAIVAVVGIGLRHTPGLAARIFRAVQPANVEVISQGASAINMTFVVREEDGPEVVRRLHAEFFGSC